MEMQPVQFTGGSSKCPWCGAELNNAVLGGQCPACIVQVVRQTSAPGDDPNPSMTEHTAQSSVDPVILRYFGDYELLGEMGRGGMGIVYKARQLSLHRVVALKLIAPEQLASPKAVERFHTEAETAARLDHPNIVPIYETGERDGRHYFSMKLIEGQSLAQRIADFTLQQPAPKRTRSRRRKEAETLGSGEVRLLTSAATSADKSAIRNRQSAIANLLAQVAEAVHYAHQRGILHRDLKPGNILIDAAGSAHVSDFGLAKLVEKDSSLTLSGEVLGTPAYMAPEQAAGRVGEITVAADVYSLGVILYELLTGRPPFARPTPVETLHAVLHEEPPAPRSVDHSVARDLETICLKCLDGEPGRRYPSAQEFADELRRFACGEPIHARAVSKPEQVLRWCRRRPTLAASLAAIALVCVVGFLGVLWQWRRAEANAVESRRLLYASDMFLAQQELKDNNLGQARRLLDRHRPQPGQEDLRGWEWRYLWQLTRSTALVTLTNRPVRGDSVSFSPDGSRLAVGWDDGRVDLWDVTGRRWIRTLTGSKNFMGRLECCVAFSPVRNLLAGTLREHNAVSLYDIDSGRESILWRLPGQSEWGVCDVEFSQDGSKVVIYAGPLIPERGDAVWVVNASSAKIESRHPTGYRSGHVVFGAALLSPDNQRLYLACSDHLNYRYSIQCLDLATGRELWRTQPLRDRGLTTLAISPDGRNLASGSGYEDATIHVWDAATGRFLAPLEGHTSWVSKLAFSKDGRRLISAAADQSIRIWDTGTWTEAKVLRGHRDQVQAVAFWETGPLVASASKAGDLMLWNDEGNKANDGYMRLPNDLIGVMALDQSRAMLVHADNPPELFDLSRGASLGLMPGLGTFTNIISEHAFTLSEHAFDTNWLCRWDSTNQIMVDEWNGSEFTRRGAVRMDTVTGPTEASFNPARQLVAWSEPAASNSVFLAALSTPGKRIEFKSDIAGLSPDGFSDDGKYLATSPRDGPLTFASGTWILGKAS